MFFYQCVLKMNCIALIQREINNILLCLLTFGGYGCSFYIFHDLLKVIFFGLSKTSQAEILLFTVN